VKIVEAHWEERNFGVTTQELIIDVSDDADSINSGIDNLTAQYQVVKLPPEQIANSNIFASRGFSFIESIIHIDTDITGWGKELPNYKIMSESERDTMLGYIVSGMFHTDRFSLDPFFPKEKVANRYKNVVFDEIERGAVLIGLLYKNDIVGFDLIKKTDESVYVCTLAGIYPPFQGMKLSGLMVGCGLSYVEDNGSGKIYTGISSNNIASLRAHLQAGYKINSITYIFIKHI